MLKTSLVPQTVAHEVRDPDCLSCLSSLFGLFS